MLGPYSSKVWPFLLSKEFGRKRDVKSKDLVSITDLSKEEIEHILSKAETMKKLGSSEELKGKILASCFFEPSTRTRLSFETAMLKLGGSCIGFSESGTTSVKKGESLSDAIKVISYADIIVIRHPQEGSARIVAEETIKPVINAGDGANQHPTQTLLDLFTIRECQGKIDGLQIAMVGDLKYGRTIHSLCLALTHYSAQLYFIAVDPLGLPETIEQELKRKGIQCSFHQKIEEVISKVDVLYMTRIQKERFSEFPIEFDNPCRLFKKQLDSAKKNLKILHPLPRVDEIETSIDKTSYAYYFQQAANGVPVRMALLSILLKLNDAENSSMV